MILFKVLRFQLSFCFVSLTIKTHLCKSVIAVNFRVEKFGHEKRTSLFVTIVSDKNANTFQKSSEQQPHRRQLLHHQWGNAGAARIPVRRPAQVHHRRRRLLPVRRQPHQPTLRPDSRPLPRRQCPVRRFGDNVIELFTSVICECS